MTPQEVAEGASALIDCVADGGAAIVPLDTAYGFIAHRPEAVRRIFTTKRRSYEKPSGMFSDWQLFDEIHEVGQRERDLVRAIILDHDLPFSVVAPYRADHPLLKRLDPFVLETTTKDGTLDMLLNAGALHNELVRLSREREVCVVGSSANVSLAGCKYRLEDIEPEIRHAADLELDGGRSRYANPNGFASTIVDLRTLSTVRVGVCYREICAILKREFGIDLSRGGGPSIERAST